MLLKLVKKIIRKMCTYLQPIQKNVPVRYIFEPLVDEFGIIFMQGDRVLFINCVLVVVCWPQAGIGWLNLDIT